MIVVYHRCPTFATGSIAASVYWWAVPDPGAAVAWRIRLVGADGASVALRDAMLERIALELGVTPSQAAAAAQDARAEAPDL